MWSANETIAATIVLAIVGAALAASGPVTVASAQADEPFTVRQEEQCYPVSPLTGNQAVFEFYDYRSTFPENPYTTQNGSGFSSEGTIDLQRADTSLLFLYEDAVGTVSLVMIHGDRERGDYGGAVSFNITGLPADGRWAVKDDEYDSDENLDRWQHGQRTAQIDWVWSRSATDGGAYEGLGDEFNVSIDPAFNAEAALFTQGDWGAVDDWQLLSGSRANATRIPLDRYEPVSISTTPCGESGGDEDAETTPGINR